MDVASRQMDLETWHVAKLHADVHSVGADGDIAAMAQTPCHPCRGGARRQTDGFVFFNQFGSGYSDVQLLFHEAMLPGFEGLFVPTRIKVQFRHPGCSSV